MSFSKFCFYGTMIGNILDNITELYMILGPVKPKKNLFRFCPKLDQMMSIPYRMIIPSCSQIALNRRTIQFCPACLCPIRYVGKLGRSVCSDWAGRFGCNFRLSFYMVYTSSGPIYSQIGRGVTGPSSHKTN